MGSKTLYVDDQESIRIQTVSFNLLTSIDLKAHLVDHIDPIYKVRFQIKPIFNQFSIDRKNQVRTFPTSSDSPATRSLSSF